MGRGSENDDYKLELSIRQPMYINHIFRSRNIYYEQSFSHLNKKLRQSMFHEIIYSILKLIE